MALLHQRSLICGESSLGSLATPLTVAQGRLDLESDLSCFGRDLKQVDGLLGLLIALEEAVLEEPLEGHLAVWPLLSQSLVKDAQTVSILGSRVALALHEEGPVLVGELVHQPLGGGDDAVHVPGRGPVPESRERPVRLHQHLRVHAVQRFPVLLRDVRAFAAVADNAPKGIGLYVL